MVQQLNAIVVTLRLPEFWLAVRRRDRDYEWLLQRKHHAFSRSLLRLDGVDDVIVDNGSIADEIQRKFPGGVDQVLEMIGTVTLKDSLHCAKQRGVVCMTGIVGNQWTLDRFAPMDAIPTGLYLTVYAGDSEDFMRTPLNELALQIEAGTLHLQAGKTFRLDEIVSAHRLMEENKNWWQDRCFYSHTENLKGRDDDDKTKS